MSELWDDGPGTTVRTRLTRMLQEAKALQIDWQQAWSIASASVEESASIFRRRRPYDLPLPARCFPTRQVLALENGNPWLGTKIPPAWKDDSEVMTLITEMGWLGTNDMTTREFARADLADAPNDQLGQLFEWMLDRRKLVALGAFSIGPTQMYLLLSPLAGGRFASRFPDVESLWQFYTARTFTDQWSTGAFEYLVQGPRLTSTLSVGVLNDDGTPKGGSVEAWLASKQTGTRDWRNSTWAGYASRFKNNTLLARQIGLELQYPGAANS